MTSGSSSLILESPNQLDETRTMAKQVYMAEDGTPFDTLEQAQEYEAGAPKRQLITQWVKKYYNNDRLTKKHTNVIFNWEIHRDAALAAVPEPEDEGVLEPS